MTYPVIKIECYHCHEPFNFIVKDHDIDTYWKQKYLKLEEIATAMSEKIHRLESGIPPVDEESSREADKIVAAFWANKGTK